MILENTEGGDSDMQISGQALRSGANEVKQMLKAAERTASHGVQP